MIRIRPVGDVNLPGDRRAIEAVQQLLRQRFSSLSEEEIQGLPQRLADPLERRLVTRLIVADNLRGKLLGFAILAEASDLGFSYLEYLATHSALSQRGVGGALYQGLQESVRERSPLGLFYECLPDDPAECSRPEDAKTNAARLRFYERFGARPILGTGPGYQLPIKPDALDMPHLVWDPIDPKRSLRAADVRAVIPAILERHYAELCTPEYIQSVVNLFQENPVRIREPRYVKRPAPISVLPHLGEDQLIVVVNEKHDIHHVRERGYLEAPIRISSILEGLKSARIGHAIPPREFPTTHLRAVHDPDMIRFLERACAAMKPGESLYPYVFPIRNQTRLPRDVSYCAGYFCTDTFTPINQNAYLAARRGVQCASTAAETLLLGQRFAYALIRPPGHHAERRSFGGFCYFNNAAVAAQQLSAHGKVAILDVDYHHGNGQQDIFWNSGEVFTVSIHGDPHIAYPFFTGFAEERGEGDGQGTNLNLPLPEQVDGKRYRKELRRACVAIQAFAPKFLIVCLGFDTARKDPTGSWSLTADDLQENGRLIRELGLPTLFVQEGGYRTVSLGANARGFFKGVVGMD